jgi:membrane associated rhomboid family serine protease
LNSQPIFNAPRVVIWLLACFFAVHLARWLSPADVSLWWTAALAFVPARYGALPPELPGGGIAAITSFITHLFVHGDLAHLFINSAWLLAFGSPVARRTDTVRFLAFFFLTGIAGALFYLATNGPVLTFVVGASGAISGLMGAAFRFLFQKTEVGGALGAARAAQTVPLMPLIETLRDARILMAILAWTLINVALAWGALGLTDAAGIAWEAHLGGFYVGLLTFGFFDRKPFFADDTPDDAAGAC